jgi:exopolysaccharide biosynthesis polyprenyl glycosylphosphotransferase
LREGERVQRAGAERFDYGEAMYDSAHQSQRWFRYEAVAKRLVDVLLAGLGLVASLPIAIAIAVAIKLDSPGPVIFVQDRVGRDGRSFRFYKFRSMYVDAERRLEELRQHNEVDGPVFKIRKDPRISKVGAFLRRTSLDELPQLFNVLKGEMSMVGPRPPLPKEVDKYRPTDMIRLSVKPGLTCLWQIRGRSTLGFDTWMEYDREYVSKLSLWLDVSILVRTVWAVLSCRGAY